MYQFLEGNNFEGVRQKSISTCNLSQISQIDFSHIDYVFSTVEIEFPLPVPVCYSGFLLDDINKDLLVKDLLR